MDAGAIAGARLRSDLIFSRRETAEGPIFVVKDPAADRFFRLREREHFILARLGSTGAAGIARAFEERFGAPLPAGSVERLVQEARRLGLVAADAVAATPAVRRPSRVQGGPLYLRIRICDPDRLFARLAARLGFLFTPAFLVLSAVTIAGAIAVSLATYQEFAHDLARILQPRYLLFAWLTVLTVSVFHESAHGVTCRRFGGEVHDIGVLFIYLQPAFYCNISDAWLFPEKAKRLWVTFSGAYFEVVLWALATLAWRLTEPDAPFHSALLVVMATSGFKNLFNLNPLIKLDGYYLLSDLLEIPNLRGRAFGHLKQWLGGWRRAPSEGAPEASRRERRVYVVYGLLAAAFTTGFLGLVLLGFGRSLIGRYQGVGFLLFSGLLVAILRRPLGSVLARPFGWVRRRLAAPLSGGGKARRTAVIAAVLGILCLARLEIKVAGEFTVLPAHNADVRAEIDGVVEEVLVREGERVATGQLLARLSDRGSAAELRTEVETAKTTLEHARRRRQEAEQVHEEELSRDTVRVRRAEQELRYARGALKRTRSLFREGLVSREAMEAAEQEVAIAGKDLEEARATLKMTEAEGVAEEEKDLAVAQTQLEAARARLSLAAAGGSTPGEDAAGSAAPGGDLPRPGTAPPESRPDYLDDLIRLTEVRAPHAGIVATPRLEEKVGQYVRKGDLIVEVHELRTVSAEIEVPERDIASVRRGQRVLLKARAHPGKTFTGVVTAVAPSVAPAEQQSWLRVVRVTTAIENDAGLLTSGMTGVGKIFCGKTSLLDLVTRRVMRYIRVEFWSWW